MLKFAEWLRVNEDRQGGKYGVYPPGYDGQGLYPPQTYLVSSADAITYMSNPNPAGHDGPPFSILHFQGNGAVQPGNVNRDGIVKPKTVNRTGITKPRSVSGAGEVKPGSVGKAGIIQPKNVARKKTHKFGDETLPE